MKNYFNFLKKTEFNKNVFSLFKGVFIAQIISVIGAVFLAKVYGAASYGFYNVFLSISGILTVLLTLNFEQSIVIDKKDTESNNIINSLCYTTIIIALCLLIFASIATHFISFLDDYYSLLIVGIIGALLIANKNILEMFLTRIKSFKIQSKTRILTATFTLTFQGILYFILPNDGLIYGFILSLLIVLIYLLWQSKSIFKIPTYSNFLASIKEHKNLIKYGLASNFINSVANNILPLLIASFFSLAATGVYALSMKIVLTPMLLLSSSVSQVYFQKASEINNQSIEKLYHFTKKIVIVNVLIILLILILINTIGLYFLRFIFNNEWKNLELYVLILSFYILCRATFNPISYLITILDRLQVGLIFNIYLVLINITAIYVGYFYNNLTIAIIFLSFFCGIGYLFIWYYFMSILKLKKR